MAEPIDRILESYSKVIEGEAPHGEGPRYDSYAVTNLRGGIGKTTLTFNLAYEISRRWPLLVVDLCAQCSLTEVMMRNEHPDANIFEALKHPVFGPAFGEALTDISYRVSDYCNDFKGGKCYFIPGSPELFAFPSPLYQRLNEAAAHKGIVTNLLLSLKRVLAEEAKDKGCKKILMDTSPFYGGGTHLAWCAADALIIPVHVDENSIQSLDLTLKMLTDPKRDFLKWNRLAEGIKTPRVAAIVMTMVGSKSQIARRPDRASCMYIERALKVAESHRELFDSDPIDAFIVIDDFVSSGRISGAKSIPISKLVKDTFHTIHGSERRLEVNKSVDRYQKELVYLASMI